MYGVFTVFCSLIIWTRIDYVLMIEVRTIGYQENDLIQTVQPNNPSDESSDREIRGEKEDAVEAKVRNFLPIKGKQKWMRREFPPVTEMLFFNISTIGDNEEVTLAQLHLHRRRLAKTPIYHKRFLPSPYRVILYQIQPEFKHRDYEDARTMKLASIPVTHATRGGWYTLDVTAVVRELLINAQGPVELLLGIQFRPPKRQEKSYSPLVPLKYFLKNSGILTPEHPYKTSSYLVVFSETDPYYEEFEDETLLPTSNFLPTSSPVENLKERHFKHKILKDKKDVDLNKVDEGKPFLKEDKDKALWKYKKTENEVLKLKKDDFIRHKGKHKGSEVKRSKADEIALKEKTKLKSLPFLHTNEVEEIRQTSRRLTRSSKAHSTPYSLK